MQPTLNTKQKRWFELSSYDAGLSETPPHDSIGGITSTFLLQMRWMKNTCNRKFWLLYTADFEHVAELVVWIIFVRLGIFWNTSSTIQWEVLLPHSYPDKVNVKNVQPQILTPLIQPTLNTKQTGGLNHLRTRRDILKHLQLDSTGGITTTFLSRWGE